VIFGELMMNAKQRNRFERHGCANARGQAMVEFALVAGIAMIILFMAVQFAMIGQVALALGQMNYQGARYASTHPGCFDSGACVGADAGKQNIRDYMLSVGSPVFNANSGNLTVSCLPVIVGTTPRAFGTSIKCTASFTLPSSVLFLRNPFMSLYPGFGIKFPTQLNSSETTMQQ
jgi:hypothetical protein